MHSPFVAEQWGTTSRSCTAPHDLQRVLHGSSLSTCIQGQRRSLSAGVFQLTAHTCSIPVQRTRIMFSYGHLAQRDARREICAAWGLPREGQCLFPSLCQVARYAPWADRCHFRRSPAYSCICVCGLSHIVRMKRRFTVRSSATQARLAQCQQRVEPHLPSRRGVRLSSCSVHQIAPYSPTEIFCDYAAAAG